MTMLDKIIHWLTKYVTKKEKISVFLIVFLAIMFLLISFYLVLVKTPKHPDFSSGHPQYIIDSYEKNK